MLRDLLNLALQPLSMAATPEDGLVLKGTIDQVRQAARRARMWPIKGVEIIGHERAADPSCAFIAGLQTLRFVRLFAAPLTDMQSLQLLPNLRHLVISHVAKGQSISIDFASLPALERAEVEWFQGAATIFRAKKLRSLALANCPSSSSEAFENLRSLTSLRLSAGRLTEIEALKELPELRWLALLKQTGLENFHGLSGHPALGFLWIEACLKLGTLEWLAGMERLETLRILDCGKIVGIEVFRSLHRLRHIQIHGAITVAADDFTFLRNLQI
jgi:hypothetical protein